MYFLWQHGRINSCSFLCASSGSWPFPFCANRESVVMFASHLESTETQASVKTGFWIATKLSFDDKCRHNDWKLVLKNKNRWFWLKICPLKLKLVKNASKDQKLVQNYSKLILKTKKRIQNESKFIRKNKKLAQNDSKLVLYNKTCLKWLKTCPIEQNLSKMTENLPYITKTCPKWLITCSI